MFLNTKTILYIMVDKSSKLTGVTTYVDVICIDYSRQVLQSKFTPYTKCL